MNKTRPSTYSIEIVEHICERLANGDNLKKICSSAGMPQRSTVFRWLATPENQIFRDMYARAREAQADLLADEIVALSDKVRTGRKVTKKGDGTTEIVSGDMVERSRLQVEARKWVAAKLKPRVYGDRQQVEHSGSIGIADTLRQARERRKNGGSEQ